jgi:hypothetical protein
VVNQRTYKLAFLGEPGVGKSTCIGAISDIGVVSTDVGCTDELIHKKATTTVAFDYGEMDLGAEGRLLLYGMPGQRRFDFMIDVVREGLVGAVILVDASSDAGLHGLEETLDAQRALIQDTPTVVALNKSADTPADFDRRCLDALRRRAIVAPIVRVDARSRQDVARIAKLLFAMIAFAARAPIQDSIQ